MEKVKFVLKQYIKMFFQHVLLPAVYTIYRRKPVKKGYFILADEHHDSLPFSMSALRRELYEYPELDVHEMFHDFARHSALENAFYMIRFMREYAQAETVVICDDFLPVASCHKRKGTKVIQMWHACGAFKRFGRDSSEDIPSFYRGSVSANWNMVTVSSPACVRPFASAFELPSRRIRPIGVSRTDEYFSEEFNHLCQRRFFSGHPEARGRRIVLWAPTFRGNAAQAQLEGLEAVKQAEKMLGSRYYFIYKPHPHTRGSKEIVNCSMPTEELLAVADVLVTDYSSILFDAMIYRLPLVLFATDFEQYDHSRGFYLNIDSIPAAHATNARELALAIDSKKTFDRVRSRKYSAFCQFYMEGCDGHATERLMNQILAWSR